MANTEYRPSGFSPVRTADPWRYKYNTARLVSDENNEWMSVGQMLSSAIGFVLKTST